MQPSEKERRPDKATQMIIQATCEERLERDLRDLAYQQPAVAALSRVAQPLPKDGDGKPRILVKDQDRRAAEALQQRDTWEKRTFIERSLT